MPLQFFTIPISDPEPTTRELNQFLAAHRICSVDQRLVDVGLHSVWAVCVTYSTRPVDGERKVGRTTPADEGRIDYRAVLSDRHFQQYARLRKLRKTLAESAGIPPYTIATNAQLATMVRNEVQTLPQLAEIAGIGETRVAKFGTQLVTELNEARESTGDPTGVTPGSTAPTAGA